jgi:glycerophosphoryl diester phosphodiesterase
MTTTDVGNPWRERRVFHWAHQGGAKEAPSNTLYAMEKGLAKGAHGLEFDVHCSREGHVVVIHDKTLERTTNGARVGLPAFGRRTGRVGRRLLVDPLIDDIRTVPPSGPVIEVEEARSHHDSVPALCRLCFRLRWPTADPTDDDRRQHQ